MDNHVVNNIRRTLNIELVRRLLIRYFYDKGFNESFDMRVYPPALMDIVDRVPELDNKVEICPFAVEMDPMSGFARLGWNLFALGNQRFFLGYSEHASLAELAHSKGQGPTLVENRVSMSEATPRQVIAFVTRTLGNSEQGMIRQVEARPSILSRVPNIGATFFRQGSPARFEH